LEEIVGILFDLSTRHRNLDQAADDRRRRLERAVSDYTDEAELLNPEAVLSRTPEDSVAALQYLQFLGRAA